MLKVNNYQYSEIVDIYTKHDDAFICKQYCRTPTSLIKVFKYQVRCSGDTLFVQLGDVYPDYLIIPKELGGKKIKKLSFIGLQDYHGEIILREELANCKEIRSRFNKVTVLRRESWKS